MTFCSVSINLRGHVVLNCDFILQVYNFLYDYESGISVNGAMSLFTFPDNHTGIYTSELSIIVPHIQLSLIVRTMYELYQMNDLHLFKKNVFFYHLQ